MDDKSPKIIMGIDPGSRKMGFGVIRVTGTSIEYLGSGCIKLPLGTMPERLKQIHLDLSELIERYHPHQAAVEDVFVHENLRGALKLGQARGAAITTLVMHDISVAEYAPRLVKKAVVGYGAADKQQIQAMMKILLNLPGLPQFDAADALAVAFCHANMFVHSRGL